jgi:hypothetical protein
MVLHDWKPTVRANRRCVFAPVRTDGSLTRVDQNMNDIKAAQQRFDNHIAGMLLGVANRVNGKTSSEKEEAVVVVGALALSVFTHLSPYKFTNRQSSSGQSAG